MNYLKQIVAFDKWEELHPLSDKAYRLWFKLMAIANASGWDEWLSVPLLKLKSELHTTSDQTVINARNALVQAGRLEVRKGKHGKSANYRLIPFVEASTGVPSGDNHGVDNGEDSGVLKPNGDNTGEDHGGLSGEDSGGLHGVNSGGLSGEDSGAYYKQNKTKLNQTKQKETPLTPQRGEDGPRPAKTAPDDVAEIVAYLNKVTGTDYKPTTKKTQQLIKARMRDGFTVADFKTVIDKKNQDEWFVTGGYMRPETLFGTKFEGYLNERPKNLAQQPAQRIYGMNM